MYLHHPLWLLPLFVAGGARNSGTGKNYQYDNYYDDDYENDYFNDKDYSLDSQMYDDDTPPPPPGNKLLIIVLGGWVVSRQSKISAFSSSIKIRKELGKIENIFAHFPWGFPLLMNPYEFPRDIICYGLYIEMVTIVKGESCVSISIYEDKDRTLYIMYVLLTVASDHTLTSIVYFRFRRVRFGLFPSKYRDPSFLPFNIRREYLNLFKIDSF